MTNSEKEKNSSSSYTTSYEDSSSASESSDHEVEGEEQTAQTTPNTKSGNNPFRKSVDEKDENMETRQEEKEAVAEPTTKMDQQEEDDPEKYAHVFKTINDEDENFPSASNFEASTKRSFDPLKTINQDDSSGWSSDGGSSSDEMSKLKRIRIREKNKENEDPNVEVEVLPAPPEIKDKAFQHELASYEDEHEYGIRKIKLERKEAENPWTESMDEEESKEKRENLLKSFENTRFNVDWQAPVPKFYATAIPTGAPKAILPELPRCETPDSDLDIPFHENKDDTKEWRLWVRYPEKKSRVKQMTKYTSDRTWKEVGIKLSEDRKRCVINVFNVEESGDLSKEPYRSVRLEPYMQLSRDKMQQYDKYGKVHIFKVNHVSYKEMLGMRPEKFTLKTFKTLASHKPKQNVALDHIPIYTEILKFGSLDHAPIKELMAVLEDKLMDIPTFKMTGLNYSDQEVSAYVTDEYVAEMDAEFKPRKQKSRTRVFCSAFVNGGPNIVLGINDKWRIGREVVRRSDILPIMNDDWISIKKPIFHSCIDLEEYEKDHMIKFYPLDGCKFELMRFRTTLVKNPEFPLISLVKYSISQRFISIRCDLTVPGYFTACRHRGAVPCENVEIHIPIPEEWIYHFRVEKHHKMGSVHSVLRKPGKIKGFERITQLAQSFLPPSILETSIGVAKYEHLYKSIVWRIPRVPEKNEASYKPHLLTCRFLLEPHDPMPDYDTLQRESHVEFTMPSTTVSGCTVRSISVESTGVVEKFVKYCSKYAYTVDIDYQLGERPPEILKSVLDEEEKSNSSGNEEEVEHTVVKKEVFSENVEIASSSEEQDSSSESSPEEEEKVALPEPKKTEAPIEKKVPKKEEKSSSEASSSEEEVSSSSEEEESSSSTSEEESSSSSSESEKDKKKKTPPKKSKKKNSSKKNGGGETKLGNLIDF